MFVHTTKAQPSKTTHKDQEEQLIGTIKLYARDLFPQDDEFCLELSESNGSTYTHRNHKDSPNLHKNCNPYQQPQWQPPKKLPFNQIKALDLKKSSITFQKQSTYRTHADSRLNSNTQRQSPSPNKIYSSVTPRYLSKNTVSVSHKESYIRKNLYEKGIKEIRYQNELNQKHRSISKHQKELRWSSFLTREKEWTSRKNNLQQSSQLKEMEIDINHIDREKKDRTKSIKHRSPIKIKKLTIEDNIKKLRREALKLKEMLLAGDIKNYVSRAKHNIR